mgnify:CR=1 FL=1
MAHSREEILEQVKGALSEKLGIEESEITEEASFEEDLGADSLDLVEVVMDLEDQFGLKIPDDDARELTTVGKAIDYVIARSPISNPLARYEQAQKMQRATLITNSQTYFNPWDTIVDANPQRILERGESVTLPPMFILQGELDDNVLPAVQERFVATYRAAGGEIDYEVFPGAEHRWIIQPGPQTDRAIAMIKAFIARQLRAQQPVG